MSNSPFPDKDLAREGWLSIVKPVELAGRLDHIPARKPVTAKDRETARLQNYWLTRRSIGGSSDVYRTNFERIKWNSQATEPNAADH
jgi:hypothetical protein